MSTTPLLDVEAGEETPSALTCPITYMRFIEPVNVTEWGHTFEREAIEEWWAQQGGQGLPKTDPLNGCVLVNAEYVEDSETLGLVKQLHLREGGSEWSWAVLRGKQAMRRWLRGGVSSLKAWCWRRLRLVFHTFMFVLLFTLMLGWVLGMVADYELPREGVEEVDRVPFLGAGFELFIYCAVWTYALLGCMWTTYAFGLSAAMPFRACRRHDGCKRLLREVVNQLIPGLGCLYLASSLMTLEPAFLDSHLECKALWRGWNQATGLNNVLFGFVDCYGKHQIWMPLLSWSPHQH